MDFQDTVTIDREIEIDNAAERERVRGRRADRAPVLAWLALLGMAACCIICRAGVL